MRQGMYFHGVVSVPTNAAARLGLDVFAVLGGVGTNGEDAVSVESGSRSVAPDPQVFVHDYDGNLLSDGVFVYSWAAENRLILASNATVKVAFAYDPLGRRVSKTVHEWDTDHWSPVTDHSFIYDGWAMIRETSSTVTNLFVYGQDLSGMMQGAGTIGGLLFADLNGEAAFYSCDANGNVVDLIGADGSIRAHYEYAPFGETLIQTGPLASANPFRFSTKYIDAETGWYYYGYRYYIPPLGRWLARDPIGEQGGPNSYLFVDNHPVWGIDPFGLHTIELKQILPPTYVPHVIMTVFGYAAGRILSPPPFQNAYNCQCVKKTKLQAYEVDITLTLELKTEIVAKGVAHPYSGQPRISAGVANTESHEANHRTGFKNAFNKFTGYYDPVKDQSWSSWPACVAAVNPIKEKIDKEWKQAVSGEESHSGSHWTTWYQQHGTTPIW